MNYVTLVFPLALIAFLLLFYWEALPALRVPLAQPQRDTRWRRRDSVVCLGITVLYALVAFADLGNTHGVETFCKFQSRGDYAEITLAEPAELGSIRYYSGLYMGEYSLYVSADGEDFDCAAALPQGHTKVFKWNEEALEQPRTARAIRIVADGKLWLGEIALYDADGALLRDLSCADGGSALIDEQDEIPVAYDYRNSTYFDEIYHPRTAYEHLENEPPYEISHPPLGKMIMSLGIAIFGMVPFGWRFMGVLFGVLMLPALYFFLKKMLGGYLIPACGTAVFAFDFMHFVQTRLATIDTYAVFFTLLMYLFFWLYWRADRQSGRWRLPLALSGVCFGLGAASKWTCIYAGGGLAVLWLLDRIFRARTLYALDRRGAYWRETWKNVLWCLVFFIAVPACIYYASYYRYGTAAGLSGGIGMFFTRDYAKLVLDNQNYMFTYHSGVTSTHPYSSVWWQWMLDIRPILYYLEYSADGARRSSFGAWVNPALCWAGLLAMAAMAYLAVRRRDKTALFILVGYLAQLLPWVLVSRVVFEYHYFPSVVFLTLALCYILRTVELRHPHGRRWVLIFTGVSLLLFLVFYPALSGLEIPTWYGRSFLRWFPTWPY